MSSPDYCKFGLRLFEELNGPAVAAFDLEDYGRRKWAELKAYDQGDDEALMSIAADCGLCTKEFYDPARHGPMDAEPGELVWVWGSL